MLEIVCSHSKKQKIKDEFMKEFAIFILKGISYPDIDEDSINITKEEIDNGYVNFDDTEDGFTVDFDFPHEIAFCILDILDMGNSFQDSFTNEDIGATGKNIVEELLESFPDDIKYVHLTIEYDDGISLVGEEIIYKNGEIVSHWEEY